MFNHKSGLNSGHAVGELKSLLDLISDPKKLQNALAELNAKMHEAAQADKALAEKHLKLSGDLASVEKFKTEVEAKAKELYEKEKRQKDKEVELAHRENAVQVIEKTVNKHKEDFETEKQSFLADISAKQKEAEARLAKASEASAKAEIFLQEYEQKVSKLKAAMQGA